MNGGPQMLGRVILTDQTVQTAFEVPAGKRAVVTAIAVLITDLTKPSTMLHHLLPVDAPGNATKVRAIPSAGWYEMKLPLRPLERVAFESSLAATNTTVSVYGVLADDG